MWLNDSTGAVGSLNPEAGGFLLLWVDSMDVEGRELDTDDVPDDHSDDSDNSDVVADDLAVSEWQMPWPVDGLWHETFSISDLCNQQVSFQNVCDHQ